MICKKKLFIFHFLIIVLGLGFCEQSFCVVIGSETAVSVQPVANFPAADLDNTMLGFGWFQNGFTLEDYTTSCTFDSVFPVSGGVNLNGGTLYLNKDLLFQNITTLNGLGTIVAQNHSLNFCSGINSLPLNTDLFQDAVIILNADLTISNTVVFQGNSTIDGNGKTVIFENGGSIAVDSNTTLLLKNLYIKDLTNKSIQCVDNSGNIILDDVTIDLVGSATFSAGSILFQNKIDFIGTSTFYYTSSQTSTIAQNSQWSVQNGMTLSIGRAANNAIEPLFFTDESSYLKFDQSNWLVTATGMQITNGTLIFDRKVEIDIQNTAPTFGLILGNSNIVNDSIFHLNSGAVVRFGSGTFVYNNVQPSQIQASSINANLIRGQNSNLVIYSNMIIPTVTIVIESTLTPPIVNNGKTVQFNASTLKFPSLEVDLTCNSLARSVLLMDGDGDSLFLTKGMLPIPIMVQGPQNSITGNGSLSGPIVLQDNNTTLTCQLDGFLYSSIAMNGGNLTLLADAMLGNNVLLTGSGTVNLTNFCFDLGAQSLLWTSTIAWQGGMNGTINLNSNLTLSSTWTINGTVIINGNDNLLTFGPTGSILVNPNSQVIFSNIQLADIGTANIAGVNNSSIITLNDVVWSQNGDYNFSHGKFNFINSVDLTGSYSFIYDSSQTSTLNSNTQLHFHDGINLVIGKKNPSSQNQPFAFTDATSVLQLENCTLNINPNGVQFTAGTVATIRNVTIDINSTSTANGLVLGDGTPAGDLNFDLYPGTTVIFPNGHVTFNLTDPTLIKSFSDSAQLIRESANIFYLANSLALNNFTISVSAATPLITAPGQSLTYNNVSYQTPVGSLTVSGEQLTSSVLLLNGNDSVFMTAGSLPFALSVSNTNNMLMGSGNSLYQISLQDSNTQLIWGMNGIALENITLNGGMLALNSDLALSNDIMLSGSGTVVLQNNHLYIGSSSVPWSDPLTWNGSGGSVELNADISLTSTWLMSGNCTIDGQGQSSLDILNGTIIVAPGSTLKLANIIVKNIHDSNIQCADNTASIILDDVTWIQNDDYNFTLGSLQIKDINLLSGKGTTFIYESVQTSTILAHSTLTLDQAFTFSYYPTDGISNNLIQFSDSSSTLRLNSANLYCGPSGIQFTNGAILFNRNCNVSTSIQNGFDNGITFGDDNQNDDVAVTILQGSQLSLIQGSINYRNVDLTSCVFTDGGSNVYLGNNTTLRLYESISVGAGTINFDGANLAHASQAQIFGGISVVGGITYVGL